MVEVAISRKVKTTLIILIVILVILSLIITQYAYSSQTNVVGELKYLDTIDIGEFYDVILFEYKDSMIGFTDDKGLSKWLIKDSLYDVEYKEKMWHRHRFMFVDATLLR